MSNVKQLLSVNILDRLPSIKEKNSENGSFFLFLFYIIVN